ncbi:MAG TPA: phage portal protein [Candidatus Aquilonibacter sp.]|nr:phage portal protein [Candidatus Aquilonibacter sp.]
MATLGERLRAFLNPPAEKASQTKAPYATSVRAQFHIAAGQNQLRRSTRMLREFADRNEALRTAINWRKQQVSQGAWRIVRTDDEKKAPNPKVVDAVKALLRVVNPKRESLRSLLDQVVEDLLVLDAGCIEKEKTFGGKIVALWGVDGGTIAPDPNWDGRSTKAIRYRQFIDGQLTAELRNDQLIYMMQNPSTHRVLGWSQVETLVQVIEAELYGEAYDYQMLRQAAPAGVLDLGRGLSDEQVESFRQYYESEIAGSKDLAIFGGGDPGSGTGITFERFGWSPREMQRDAYKSWLINKIAFVFQVDKTIFGLVDDVNRSTSNTLTKRTDQGFTSLARLVAEYFTREIVWEIDENHAFEFTDLVSVDPMMLTRKRAIEMSIGVTTPNEIRAEDGKEPVAWGDVPYVASSTPTPDPLEDDEQQPQPKPSGAAKPGDDEDEPAGKRLGN